MHSEATADRLERLREKHAEGLLLWELENGFELSPRASELVFVTAKNILVDHRRAERGKQWIVGVEIGQSTKSPQGTIGTIEDSAYGSSGAANERRRT